VFWRSESTFRDEGCKSVARVALQSALQTFTKQCIQPSGHVVRRKMICSWNPSLFHDRSSELLTDLEYNYFQ